MRAHRGVSRRIDGRRRTPTDCICESCLIVGFSQEARFTLTYQLGYSAHVRTDNGLARGECLENRIWRVLEPL